MSWVNSRTQMVGGFDGIQKNEKNMEDVCVSKVEKSRQGKSVRTIPESVRQLRGKEIFLVKLV